ncbi:transmembrane protease serine 11B-like [Mustela nigripes]|uniref:Transmembrane protease serine n=1 Tax=Mustela putorius furo TaxID=9669 RepID=A0A8U0T080_MUSPF|nr:transmembrane protease serine 11B [Mustela putorius furo]XP_059233054.1 transmembrane protease serine 11B-like [Mustela nigripes]
MKKRHGMSSRGRSWSAWVVIFIFLGVTAILGITIGLLVHFLAVGRIFYYQGDFHISGVTYNDSCENGASQASTDLSKNIETKMLEAFQNSSIYKEYINSQVIKILPDSNGSSVQFQLTFKFPPAKRDSMKTEIEAIFPQILKDNMAFWNAVPTSMRLIEISKANVEILTNNCCGRPSNSIIPGNRIVNGENALVGAWPWQASMQWKGQHYCGASLISSRWLLSAAHCFAKKNNSDDWTVNFGTVVNKPYMTQKVQNIIFHENYSSPGVYNDIALVQLAEEISFTKYVRRICLPEAKMKLSENASVVVTGWGTLYMNGPLPVKLQQASLKIIDNEVCNAPHALSGTVTDKMLCAGFMSGKADACQNDSGGPLAYPNSRNIWHLVGIVSWGDGCAEKNKPGVYTRVTAYRDWITSKTGL